MNIEPGGPSAARGDHCMAAMLCPGGSPQGGKGGGGGRGIIDSVTISATQKAK